MLEEAISILKEINQRLDNLNSNTELILYDIPKIMEITGLGYNRVQEFFKNKEKYPTFPGFKARKKIPNRS